MYLIPTLFFKPSVVKPLSTPERTLLCPIHTYSRYAYTKYVVYFTGDAIFKYTDEDFMAFRSLAMAVLLETDAIELVATAQALL